MSRASERAQLVESIRGQHVALPVAAHYARMQLAPYDTQHFIELIDMAGAALARVAPLYTQDAGSAAPRRLSPFELEDAVVSRAATVVVLRDGRTLSRVSIRREDLRRAIAVLEGVRLSTRNPAHAS